MHSDAQVFLSMSPPQKRKVYIYLAKIALNQWEQFSASGMIPSSYIESVVGTQQIVSLDLPRKALDCVVENSGASAIQKLYREPICALQDDDWSLPEDASYAYFAVYNLFKKYALKMTVDDWLIVNQALSSLGSASDAIRPTLAEAIRQAG